MDRDHIVLTSWRCRQTPESMVTDGCVPLCSVKSDSYLDVSSYERDYLLPYPAISKARPHY